MILGYQIFGQRINRVEKIIAFGLKQGKVFGIQAAQPHPILVGVPPVVLWTVDPIELCELYKSSCINFSLK